MPADRYTSRGKRICQTVRREFYFSGTRTRTRTRTARIFNYERCNRACGSANPGRADFSRASSDRATTRKISPRSGLHFSRNFRKKQEGRGRSRGVAWMVIRDVDTSRERNGARGIACDTESGRARRIGRRRFPSLGFSLTSGCLIGVETTGVTGTPWPCRRPNARMPIACRIQGDPPSLVRYHGERGNYSQHATSYDRVRAFATLPASFPRSPRFSAPLSFVVPCRVAPRPFVSTRFHSFRFALDAKRVISSNPWPSYRRRRMLPSDRTSSPSVLLVSRGEEVLADGSGQRTSESFRRPNRFSGSRWYDPLAG